MLGNSRRIRSNTPSVSFSHSFERLIVRFLTEGTDDAKSSANSLSVTVISIWVIWICSTDRRLIQREIPRSARSQLHSKTIPRCYGSIEGRIASMMHTQRYATLLSGIFWQPQSMVPGALLNSVNVIAVCVLDRFMSIVLNNQTCFHYQQSPSESLVC